MKVYIVNIVETLLRSASEMYVCIAGKLWRLIFF